MVEKGMHIKVLRFDGGGECFSDKVSDYLKEQGIQTKYSCRSIPHGCRKKEQAHCKSHKGYAEWKKDASLLLD